MVEPYDFVADPELAIEQALKPADREAFVAAIVDYGNPSWQGAPVADILDTLYDTDAYLNVREPYWQRHGIELADELAQGHGEPINKALLVVHVLAVARAEPDAPAGYDLASDDYLDAIHERVAHLARVASRGEAEAAQL